MSAESFVRSAAALAIVALGLVFAAGVHAESNRAPDQP